MPQDLFFAIAAQIDWRLAARRYLINLLAREGYQTDGVTSTDEHALQAVAELNKIGKEFLLTALNPRLQRDVFYDANMAKDFRVAMSHLCLMERSAEQPHPGQPIIDWLTGVNTRISNVKPFSIYNPINRTTARHLLRSAMGAADDARYPGLTVVAAITEDFVEAILEEKGDRLKVPARLRERGEARMARQAELGMQWLSSRRTRLSEVTDDGVDAAVEHIRRIYSRAYDWTAPSVSSTGGGAGYQKRMRYKVRAAITTWDLQRLCDADPDMETEEYQPTYHEDHDLEVESQEDTPS